MNDTPDESQKLSGDAPSIPGRLGDALSGSGEGVQTEHHLADLHFFENLDRINRVIQSPSDLDQMMRDILDVLLSVFACDRAWLVFPCDPDAPMWQVPMERTRPEYPGVLPIGVELPLDPVGAAVYRTLRESPGPVQFGPGGVHPVPVEMATVFQVQSFIAMAIYPKVGKPWSYGLHQCSYARIWTPQEVRLFQEIGRRLSDALSSLLSYRDVQESERRLRRYNLRLSVLHDIDRRILVASSQQEIASAVLQHLLHLIPCEWLSIVLYNADMTEEWIIAWEHAPQLDVALGDPQPVVPNQGLEQLQAGVSIIAADLAAQEGPRARLADALVEAGMHGAMANPMIVEERLIGVLALSAKQIGFFTEEHREIAEEIAAQVAIAFRQAELSEQIDRYNRDLERRVKERTAELERANHEMALFSYSVSHDLRAPLRAVQGFAEIIARRHRDSLNDEGRRYFDYIVSASAQMDQLISDLLDYVRLGRHRIDWERIALPEVLSRVADSLTTLIAQTEAHIHLAQAMPEIDADRMLLMRIFTNLLENALVYHRPGVAPRVEVTSALTPDSVIVRVQDNGIGIPVEFREKIFDIFQRLHSPDQFPGTGIGLAVVRRSVELLNGTVWVESVEDGGSAFCIRFPRRAA
ncbi:MAG: GAF domain-containing protein [Anaerolineae bacterium]|nr:GAF domain-containing protein [Anaerolineae bacterium]